ncbi:MAG: glycosyltransferase family 39 protein [Chloroflexi bacterium]|nr:glycosyltransferase family 39 protein [Chloroflexota bacterium]
MPISVVLNMSQCLNFVTRPLRDHLHFLIIVPLLIIVTTWPLAQNILDVHSLHRPPGDADVLIEFWDAWYGKLLLTGRADYFYTELLFYPDGLSLAFHHLGLPHIFIFGGLQAVLPAVNAFFLTYMITVFSNALASYIFLRQLFPGKWIALFGAVIFSFSPYFLPHARHLDQITIWTIPLTLYAFHRGIVEGRWKWLVAAGFFAGLTAFIIMYNLVCLFITMALYTLYLASTRWRQHRFWFGVALTVLVAASIGSIRLYPMTADPTILGEALDKGANTPNSTDLLVFLVNPRHPFTPTVFDTLFHRAPPNVPPNGYLGLLPLLLIVVGLFRSGNRRLMAPWLALAFFFAVLRFGHVLQIDGRVYSDFLLPKYHLDILVPWLTKAFWQLTFPQIGILLPLAVLSCYGLQAILVYLPRNLRAAAVLIVITLVAFEYYQPPIPSYPRFQPQYQWIDWLAAEPDQDSIRLVNLPMGRNRSKRYLYHQSLHGYPQVEGLASRTPGSAYDYIEGNLLLSVWRAGKSINCLGSNIDEFATAHAELMSDGFTHIVLHRGTFTDQHLASSFVDIPASYTDEHVQIYRLIDLRDTCDVTASLSETFERYVEMIEGSGSIVPDGNSGIFVIYPFVTPSPLAREDYLTALKSDADLLRLDIQQLIEASNSNTGLRANHGYEIVRSIGVLLFAYDPSATGQALTDSFHSFLSLQYNACGRIIDTETTLIEYFLRGGFPCELALTEAPFAVRYDNDIQLGNLLTTVDDDTLALYVLWKRLPSERHAISIQFFDESGSKAYGQDFVIPSDALSRNEIDLSALEPGTYDVKLIVYNYETGASVPGNVLSSGTRIDRALDFMTLPVE